LRNIRSQKKCRPGNPAAFFIAVVRMKTALINHGISVMRGHFLTRVTLVSGRIALHLLVEQTQVLLQLIDLLLLAEHGEIKFLQHVLGKSQLGLQLDQTIFHGGLSKTG
jgi:hypothetical protein